MESSVTEVVRDVFEGKEIGVFVGIFKDVLELSDVEENLRLRKLVFDYGGQLVTTRPRAGITYCIVVKQQTKLKADIAFHALEHHLVNTKWLEESIEQGLSLPLENYYIAPEYFPE